MPTSFWCHTFVTVDRPRAGLFEIQWQFPALVITCVVNSLEFAREIVAFVEETRGNPKYRDEHLGGGTYRSMPEKSIDLSRRFEDLHFKIQKDGEYDHVYVLRFAVADTFRCTFELGDHELDAFMDGIVEIIEECEVQQTATTAGADARR